MLYLKVREDLSSISISHLNSDEFIESLAFFPYLQAGIRILCEIGLPILVKAYLESLAMF